MVLLTGWCSTVGRVVSAIVYGLKDKMVADKVDYFLHHLIFYKAWHSWVYFAFVWQYILEAEVVNKVTSDSVALGAHLVDFLPFRTPVLFISGMCHFTDSITGLVKYLPKWIPFATFHREADAGRRLIDRMITRPFDHAIKEIVSCSTPALLLTSTFV